MTVQLYGVRPQLVTVHHYLFNESLYELHFNVICELVYESFYMGHVETVNIECITASDLS